MWTLIATVCLPLVGWTLCHLVTPGGRLNIKMLSYQYRDPLVKNKTVSWLFILTWESPYLERLSSDLDGAQKAMDPQNFDVYDEKDTHRLELRMNISALISWSEMLTYMQIYSALDILANSKDVPEKIKVVKYGRTALTLPQYRHNP